MNYPSLSQWSFAKGTGGVNPPELYIPLWFYSGGTASESSNSNVSSGYVFIDKASNTPTTGTGSGRILHTLGNWSATQQFAFEIALSAGGTINAGLYDLTSNTLISYVSTTSATMVVLRTGKFTLTPGHQYGITLWGTSGVQFNATDASLIVFPQ